MGGMAAALCFSCFRSSGFCGEELSRASLAVLSRLGRGDSNLGTQQDISHGQAPWPTAPPHPAPLSVLPNPEDIPCIREERAGRLLAAGNLGSKTTPVGLHVQTTPLCLAQEALEPTFPHPHAISSKAAAVQNKPEGKWTLELGVVERGDQPGFHLDIVLPSRAHTYSSPRAPCSSTRTVFYQGAKARASHHVRATRGPWVT